MTWEEAYREACITEAEAALRGHALMIAVLVALVLLFPTAWVVLPAGVAGLVVAWRGIRWGARLAQARMGRIHPPYDNWR
jgi:hypothetical protein